MPDPAPGAALLPQFLPNYCHIEAEQRVQWQPLMFRFGVSFKIWAASSTTKAFPAAVALPYPRKSLQTRESPRADRQSWEGGRWLSSCVTVTPLLLLELVCSLYNHSN